MGWKQDVEAHFSQWGRPSRYVRPLAEPEYCNEAVLYRHFAEHGLLDDVWTAGQCRREGAGEIPHHLERFTMVEASRVGKSPQDVLDEVIEIYLILSKVKRLNLMRYDFGHARNTGRREEARELEMPPPKKPLPEHIVKQQNGYLLDMDSALSCFWPVPGGPGHLLVLQNMPPQPFAPTENRDLARIEVYALMGKNEYPLEIANIYHHNNDLDDMRERGWEGDDAESPKCWTTDFGVGVERCMLAGGQAESINRLQWVAERL